MEPDCEATSHGSPDVARMVNPAEEPIPGYFSGRHYTQWVDRVKHLKRSEQYDLALGLLAALIDAAETEADEPIRVSRGTQGSGPARVVEIVDPELRAELAAEHRRHGPALPPPWYYEQAAIIHHKQQRFDLEAEILERYLRRMDTARRPANGDEIEARVSRRLVNAKIALAKQASAGYAHEEQIGRERA
ncbi:hypothetical protein [Nocardioides sp. L-11A]|uniref:hypothetical protein n=1 Tax=Nocardioides sp. L-11A TaxID=3043848 RepID=UPI00249C6FD7|nr:hypothetical protein QJ852_10050 [Nocardioides sp. L-11A]